MADVSEKEVRLSVLGGLGEIGMNCLLIESKQNAIVIDCGLLFTELDTFGVQYIIPNFSTLLAVKDKIRAFILTHGHEDHIGALPYAIRCGVKAPIYASPFTARLAEARLREKVRLDKVEIRRFMPGQTIELPDFTIDTIPVNHSIVEASALSINTPVGRILHTGDFRIDPTPYYGRALDSQRFRQLGDEGVRLMLSDSTNVEVVKEGASEKTLYSKIEEVFTVAEGLVVISMFASNIARMGQVIEAARKLGKKVTVTGRTMEDNLRHAMETGYLENAKDIVVDLAEAENIPKNKLICLSTGSQGEFRSALNRMSQGEHATIDLEGGDLVIMSSKFIPGNEKAIGRVINNLFKQGSHVLYDAIHEVHVSGHATRPELRKMLEWVRPQFFMPVHGEYRHLVLHRDLAHECGIAPERVQVGVNGDVFSLTADSFVKLDPLDTLPILIEGETDNEVTKKVLKDRRKLAEKGVVFVLMTREPDDGRIVAGPQIVAKGLVKEEEETLLLEDATKAAKAVINQYHKRLGRRSGAGDLEEEVRLELRKFFNSRVGFKPNVIAMVLDL